MQRQIHQSELEVDSQPVRIAQKNMHLAKASLVQKLLINQIPEKPQYVLGWTVEERLLEISL